MAVVQALVEDWLARTEHELAFSPGPVQDLLFELWGACEDEPVLRSEIERWLTLSLSRHLFSAEEVREVLLASQAALSASTSG